MIEISSVSDADFAAATLRITDLTERFHVTRQQIYIWIDKHGFPKPLKRNARIARWIPSQIDEWAAGANVHAN